MREIGHLRSIKPDELELMLAWRNSPAVRANMYTTHVISLDEHMTWWDRTQAASDRQYFMYEYEGIPSGIVGFTAICQSNKNSSWAFYAAPSAPKGTGSRMEYLALERAFKELGLHKLYCEVLAFNSAVIKLHQKFGFEVEGRFREQYRREEEYIDIYRLGILASVWNAKAPEILEKLIKISKA